MASIDAKQVSPPLRRGWLWLGLLGLALIVLGLWAAIHPLAASLATLLWLGVLFAVAGVAQIVQVWNAPGWKGALWHLGSGAIYLVGGMAMLFRPVAGLLTLALLVSVVLIASGTLRIFGGLALRPLDGWLWLVLGGAVSVGAGVILVMMPAAESVLVPGLLVGFSLLVEGIVVAMLALAARRGQRLASG